MKPFQSEIMHSYDTYSFGYCNYAMREDSDCLVDIYTVGYLPYSGAREVKDVFYMARSLRIVLAQWALNSENKRIQKRFSGLQSQLIPVDQFNYCDKTFLQFCVDYFVKRHDLGVMPRERILYLLDNFVTHILEYRREGTVMAYVFLVQDDSICHFSYSFYDLAYVNQSLGLWLMIDAARRAKQSGKKYFYLGTVYGDKALYKTNFQNFEYWDGNEWIKDVNKLKKMSRTDEIRTLDIKDEWKEWGYHF